jgi:hypothetical protein
MNLEVWVNGCLWDVRVPREVLASVENARWFLGPGIQLQIRQEKVMSKRIFEANGLYVTSVAQPLGAGPVLEFDTAGANPRLNEKEIWLLFESLQAWLDEHGRISSLLGLDDPNR